MFFPNDERRFERYLRSPREPEFESARVAIAPTSFYPDALQWLLANQLVVISGPPHVGKTILGRKMAIEVTSRDPNLRIIDIEQSALDVFNQTSDIRQMVVVLHDPFAEREPSGAKWPLFRYLMEHNFVIVTCRNNELISSNISHRLNESPFYQHVKIIKGDAYNEQEMHRIFELYYKRAMPQLTSVVSGGIDSDRLAKLVKAKLHSPHAIAYFFESILRRKTPATFNELAETIKKFDTIEEAIRNLYQSSTQAQKLFLLLVAALNGQYEESQVRRIYDDCVQIAAAITANVDSFSFRDCLALFGDIVGVRMTQQYRYRAFEDIGLSFLHPSYREVILRCGLESPLDRKCLYECAKQLIRKQVDGPERYDLASAGFEIIDENWSEFEHTILAEASEWIPYNGDFGDHIQALYFRQLQRLVDKVPDKVIDECRMLLRDGLVDRSRGGLVRAAFKVAVVKPREGLALLAANGDLGVTNESARNFAEILTTHRDDAWRYLKNVPNIGRVAAKALLISSLRYLGRVDFQTFGIKYVEQILDKPWKLKERFMNLWVVPLQMENLARLPPHFETLLNAWRDSDNPKKYGFLVTLWHSNMLFLNLPEEIWLPLLKLLLEKKIDSDSECSFIDVIQRYLDTVTNNLLKDEIYTLVEKWLATLSTDPEAAKSWRDLRA